MHVVVQGNPATRIRFFSYLLSVTNIAPAEVRSRAGQANRTKVFVQVIHQRYCSWELHVHDVLQGCEKRGGQGVTVVEAMWSGRPAPGVYCQLGNGDVNILATIAHSAVLIMMQIEASLFLDGDPRDPHRALPLVCQGFATPGTTCHSLMSDVRYKQTDRPDTS